MRYSMDLTYKLNRRNYEGSLSLSQKSFIGSYDWYSWTCSTYTPFFRRSDLALSFHLLCLPSGHFFYVSWLIFACGLCSISSSFISTFYFFYFFPFFGLRPPFHLHISLLFSFVMILTVMRSEFENYGLTNMWIFVYLSQQVMVHGSAFERNVRVSGSVVFRQVPLHRSVQRTGQLHLSAHRSTAWIRPCLRLRSNEWNAVPVCMPSLVAPVVMKVISSTRSATDNLVLPTFILILTLLFKV